VEQDRPLSRVPLSPSIWSALVLLGISAIAVLAAAIVPMISRWLEHR